MLRENLMIRRVKRNQLKNGWLVYNVDCTAQPPPPTEPREFSLDPAFGDFNLELDDGGVSLLQQVNLEEASDLQCLQDALDADDFEPYEEFRQNELGL